MLNCGLIYLPLAAFAVISAGEIFKQAEDFKYMSSFSTYDKIRGDITTLKEPNKNCAPVKIWALHRHGTRYPSASEITDMENLATLRDQVVENHASNRGILTKDQINRLREWSFDSSIGDIPNYLTDSGFNETKRKANRFKSRFPNLLNKPYTAEKVYFQHSDTQRTAQTSYAFIDGIFGDDAHQTVDEHVDSSTDDFLLYPFGGGCPKLAALIGNTTYLYGASNAFTETNVYTEALRRLSERLGFSTTLPAEALITIFGSCAYESAWYQESTPVAPWCVAIDTETRKIGEYYWDLIFQSIGGYSGEEVNTRAGCGPVRDLWQRFATAVGELNIKDKTEDSTFLFSHDAQLILVQTSLGLNRDDPALSSDNYSQLENRLFRTSTLVPFASNLAAVLLECKKPKGPIEYEVLLLRNEHRWQNVPGCPNGVCKWKAFRNLMKSVSDNCNIEEFC